MLNWEKNKTWDKRKKQIAFQRWVCSSYSSADQNSVSPAFILPLDTNLEFVYRVCVWCLLYWPVSLDQHLNLASSTSLSVFDINCSLDTITGSKTFVLSSTLLAFNLVFATLTSWCKVQYLTIFWFCARPFCLRTRFISKIPNTLWGIPNPITNGCRQQLLRPFQILPFHGLNLQGWRAQDSSNGFLGWLSVS